MAANTSAPAALSDAVTIAILSSKRMVAPLRPLSQTNLRYATGDESRNSLLNTSALLSEDDSRSLQLHRRLCSGYRIGQPHAFGTLTSINSFATVTADCVGPSSDCWPVT